MKGDTSSYLTRNTRGIEAFGNLGSHISFYTSFYENQGGFFPHEMAHIDSTGVIPGQGEGKEFKETQLDWSWVTGHLYIRANRNLEFVLGYGKNFIGHGYRSIILSDQAFNYPYLRTQLNLLDKRLYFNTIWLQTQSWDHAFDFVSDHHNYQCTSYHILGWNPHVLKGLNLSFIEGVSGKDYTFAAADLRISPIEHLNLYAQARLNNDDYAQQKTGYQAGIEVFNVFELFGVYQILRSVGVFRNNCPLKWHIQAEYNSNPMRITDPVEYRYTFGHYSEPLQFSLKKETLLITDLTLYRRFEVSLMHSDSDLRKFTDLKLSLIANPTTKWKFYLGTYKRSTAGNPEQKIIYFGTSICTERRYEREM